jgi:hypothetical protein
MVEQIYDSQTRRYVSIQTAMTRNFPSDRFTVRKGFSVYAVQDRRTRSGFRYEILTAGKVPRNRNNELIYPNLRRSTTVPIDNLQNIPFHEAGLFTLPIELLEQNNINSGIVQFQFLNNGTVINESPEINLNSIGSANRWWGNEGGEGFGIFNYNNSNLMTHATYANIQNSTHFRVVTHREVSPQRIQQRFRDGIDHHCVLTPILKHFENLVASSKTPKTAKNRQSFVNKVQVFLKTYAEGIPEEDMESVANALDIKIIMEDIFHNVVNVYNDKRVHNGTFKFINSRLNHAEYLTININAEPIYVQQDEAQVIIQEYIDNNKYCCYTGSRSDIKTITTAENYYIVGNANGDIMNEFNSQFPKEYKINSVKEKNLAKFILKSANLVVNWKNPYCNSEPVNEIDMKKAYTQFKHSPNYVAFPSIITDYRSVKPDHDVSANLGVYMVKIISIPSPRHPEHPNYNACKLLRAMGFCFNSKYVLTSPWILTLRQFGVQLETIYGAYAASSFEFEFSKEMIESKMYSIWTGTQLHTEEESFVKVPCTSEFASHIKAISTNDAFINYVEETQTLTLRKPREFYYIMPHVSSFIVSYTQLNVFNEMLKYNPENIVGTKLDSIMLSSDVKAFDSNLWGNIKDKSDSPIKINKYTSSVIFNQVEEFEPENLGSICEYEGQNFFLSGQGGGGKTYKILNDVGFRNKYYCTISWKLVSETVNKYNCFGGTLNQLLGFDTFGKKIPSIKDKFGAPPVIILDEMSMISEQRIMEAMAMYPKSKFIFLGDYHNKKYYQSSVSDDKLYTPEHYYMVTTDYRSLDEETKQFKLKIRQLIDENKKKELFEFVNKTLPHMKVEDLVKHYDMDFILTGSHERVRFFTELLQNETKNHYLVEKHSFNDVLAKKRNPESAYLHGEIIDFPIEGRTKLTHAFTLHSFQGSTIETKKCFIDISKIFNSNDLYTAISRVRRMNQIILIKGDASLPF